MMNWCMVMVTQLRCVAEYYMRKAEVEALYTKMAAVHGMLYLHCARYTTSVTFAVEIMQQLVSYL